MTIRRTVAITTTQTRRTAQLEQTTLTKAKRIVVGQVPCPCAASEWRALRVFFLLYAHSLGRTTSVESSVFRPEQCTLLVTRRASCAQCDHPHVCTYCHHLVQGTLSITGLPTTMAISTIACRFISTKKIADAPRQFKAADNKRARHHARVDTAHGGRPNQVRPVQRVRMHARWKERKY